jgi:hypothetical protein
MNQPEGIKRLTDLGFVVFPVELLADGDKVDKKPRVGGWQKAPPPGIDWKREFQPEDVIGVQLPPETVVLDIDYPEEFAKKQLEHNSSVSSPSRRAGGKHVFYRTDGRPVRQTQKGSGLGFDTRVGGKGFVVAWHPENWAPADHWGMAPEWLYHFADKSSTDEPLGRDEKILAGQRHEYYLALAGKLWNLGLNEAGILAALRSENTRRSPDHADKDLLDIAAWIVEQDQALPADLARPLGQSGAIGGKTLYDLPHGACPPQLVDPFLSPEGATVIYGPGGVGKGYVGVYLALRLVRSGKTVMIIDYENHPGEWGRRARQLGFSDDELRMVHYRAPFGDDWQAKRDMIHHVADLLRADAEAHSVDYFIVDSYTTASSTSEAMGGSSGAQEFYEGLKRLGQPALVIAHVASKQGKFPDKPFGSIFVHNLSRETWAVERYEDDSDVRDPLQAVFEEVMRLELRNQKMNVGSKPDVQFLNFHFKYTATSTTVDVDGLPPASRKTYTQMVREVLRRSKSPMDLPAISKAVKDSTGVAIKTETLRRTLTRNFTRDESGPTLTWTDKIGKVSGGVSDDDASTGHEPDTGPDIPDWL